MPDRQHLSNTLTQAQTFVEAIFHVKNFQKQLNLTPLAHLSKLGRPYFVSKKGKHFSQMENHFSQKACKALDSDPAK